LVQPQKSPGKKGSPLRKGKKEPSLRGSVSALISRGRGHLLPRRRGKKGVSDDQGYRDVLIGEKEGPIPGEESATWGI